MKRNFEISRAALTSPPLKGLGLRALVAPSAPLVQPPREPRDEAALLLTVVAEVEHALMVQYLYAAYSVRYDQENHAHQGAARSIHLRLLQIAREEMGHLITVQNLLQVVGAPLNLEREHSPFESELYPFRFKLERLSSHSLAKYVTAERPAEKPPDISDEDWNRLEEVEVEARAANDGHPVQHVGAIFARLITLFEDGRNGIQDGDLQVEQRDQQATWDDWGFDESLDRDDSRKVIVDVLEGSKADNVRARALSALREIAEQGEGFADRVESHFKRFYQLYHDFRDLQSGGVDFIWPVATTPHTTPVMDPGDQVDDPVQAARAAFQHRGSMTCERSRNWGDLFNFRYRLLLSCLSHFLHITGPRYVTTGPDKGDRTPRGFLLQWTFNEMRHLRKIAQKLVTMPLCDHDGSVHAGPPFQLPYTLAIPEGERQRWRTHLDTVSASQHLLDVMMAEGLPERADPFLVDLREADSRMQAVLAALVTGSTLPGDAHFIKFQKAAHILEEAVRGFTIEAHGNFWTGLNRERFVNLHIFNQAFFARDPNADCRLQSAGSQLLNQLQSRTKVGHMPRYRPNIDPSRLQFYREWVDAQAPDNDPPCQIGVYHERTPAPEPGGNSPPQLPETPSYRNDVRKLFRPFDVAMFSRFENIDLDNVESVRDAADSLRRRFEAGSLPYDASWLPDQIALFGRWVDTGMHA
jgi:hypothetical protein